jgi:hypothetical protein
LVLLVHDAPLLLLYSAIRALQSAADISVTRLLQT